MSSLEQDPAYLRRVEEDERSRQQSIMEYKRAEAPILAELSEAGFELNSLSYWVNNNVDYEAAIAILLKWLSRTTNEDIKDSLVRVLTVRWTRPLAAKPLIEEFLKADDLTGAGIKWTIGNALSVVADDTVFDEVVTLVRDKRHGRAREMIAVALRNMKNPKAVDVLIDLLDDEEVAGHALIALGKLRAKEAKPHIEPFLTHPKAWVRAEAKRALAKIEKAKVKDKLSKVELIQLVEKIISQQGTEDEIYEWLRLVQSNVPDQEVSDIIYWPSTRGLPDKLTAEQIVDIALSHKPRVIQLGPKSTNDEPQSKR